MKKILLLLLLSSISLLSNAQARDTFNYTDISVCYSIGNTDSCDVILFEHTTVIYDLIQNVLYFTIQDQTEVYSLSSNWIMGGSDEMILYIDGYKNNKTFNFILSKNSMTLINTSQDCLKFKYSICGG